MILLSQRIKLFLVLTLTTSSSALVIAADWSRDTAKAHVLSQARQIAAQELSVERKLKIIEFKDMPVIVREVKHLQSEAWYNDLAIEVKNVSNKPIYFLLAYLDFPDVPVSHGVSGITMEFGARENLDYRRIANSKDAHLKPGETILLTIPEQYRRGLKVKQERQPENVTKFEMHFGVVSFGDGTGFVAERFKDSRLK